MQKFEEGKKYVFSKDLYLSDPLNAAYYKSNKSTRETVDRIDGKELNKFHDYIGVIGEQVVYHEWCSEILPHLTQIVREVANQRYKTALQRALEQHPEMIEDKQ